MMQPPAGPYGPMPPPQPRPDTAGATALVLALCGFLCGLTTIPALFVGTVAVMTRPSTYGKAALIIAGLQVALWGVFWVWALAS